jgi:hypothetical protein
VLQLPTISASPGLSPIPVAVVEGQRWLFGIARGAMEFKGFDNVNEASGYSWESWRLCLRGGWKFAIIAGAVDVKILGRFY